MVSNSLLNQYITIGSTCLSALIMLVIFFIKKPSVDSIFSYEGRIGRKKFIKIMILSLLIIVIPITITYSNIITNIYLLATICIIFAQVSFILSLKAIIRRLHDLELSGCLFMALWAINLIGMKLKLLNVLCFLFLLYLCIKRGTNGNNRYGTNPLNNNNIGTIEEK
ncbi:DUF805 domain-containing protein [Pectinatus frisingensis]|uniref:DUF805 domain-containing protein n=1 Tax=Pectinatus frisingensis TaxID=865 RepID=UPI0018C7A7AB|nr:DUF805 domain-containing protein [Pectinatus frisingensis]